MDKIYRDAMLEYVRGLEQELAEIRQLLQSLDSQSKISRMVYRTSERLLQLLTEACIGIAKQTLKAEGKPVPSDARKAFFQLHAIGLDPTGADWNRIIGMRNALVHDYLNLSPERVLDVIRTDQYQVLLDFAYHRLID
ncbi:MAG: DUF86 domain-containing protein [Candidatus Poribacteria bacterium]|jgi:uncharacterized protein YutE (UPF0331/DUF86 family)|nr:DUF86 domain-containing protein [Candidatus Poribacteria bacterium]MDP6961000.1 DUF86 domain-containing protein [Dehalococcoidia bacterium]